MFSKTCILLAALFFLAFFGCKEECRNKFPCYSGNLDIKFAGFNSSELDSVEVIRYKKGSDFITPVDTIVFATTIKGNDIYLEFLGAYDAAPIDADYDSELIISGNRIVRFSNIIVDKSAYACCDHSGKGCGHSYNHCPTTSYNQDGLPSTANPAIIHK